MKKMEMSLKDKSITYLVDLNIEGTVPCTSKCRKYTLPDKKARFKRTGEIHTMLRCEVQECPFNGHDLPEGHLFRGFAFRIFDEKRWRKLIPPKTRDICEEDFLDDREEEDAFFAPNYGDQ